jgi:hypothetical protein
VAAVTAACAAASARFIAPPSYESARKIASGRPELKSSTAFRRPCRPAIILTADSRPTIVSSPAICACAFCAALKLDAPGGGGRRQRVVVAEVACFETSSLGKPP